MTWTCFWMEPTGNSEIGLRRYRSLNADFTCPGGGYHEAFLWLGIRMPIPIEDYSVGGMTHKSRMAAEQAYPVAEDDPRWPPVCDKCGYEFTEDDHSQVWGEEVYSTDLGESFLHSNLSDHPTVRLGEAGGCYNAWWFARNVNPDKPDDGIVLGVLCPRLDDPKQTTPWIVDTASTRDGGYWTRTPVDKEDMTSLTVNPSISINPPGHPSHYHGFLHNGVLTDHLGG